MVLALTHDVHMPLMTLDPKVPEVLSNLVGRLLAKDPNRRPGSAREVAKELKRIEAQVRSPDHQQSSEGPTSKPLQVTTIPIADNNTWAMLDTESPMATPSNASKFMAASEKPVWPWIAGGVLVLVAAAIIGLTAFGGKKAVVNSEAGTNVLAAQWAEVGNAENAARRSLDEPVQWPGSHWLDSRKGWLARTLEDS